MDEMRFKDFLEFMAERGVTSSITEEAWSRMDDRTRRFAYEDVLLVLDYEESERLKDEQTLSNK